MSDYQCVGLAADSPIPSPCAVVTVDTCQQHGDYTTTQIDQLCSDCAASIDIGDYTSPGHA